MFALLKLKIAGFEIMYRPNKKWSTIDHSKSDKVLLASSVVYFGGVRQYLTNNTLSTQYIDVKISNPAKYKNGIERLYSIIMKTVAIIVLYLSASSMCGPV